MAERRKSKRLAAKILTIWKLPDGKTGKPVEAFILTAKDISTSGLYFKTPIKFPIGTKVELELDLENGSPPIKALCSVAWIARQKTHPRHYPGTGIKFLKMCSRDRARLNRYLLKKAESVNEAMELKNMYLTLKEMAGRLVELEEKHPDAPHFKQVIDNAITEIDDVAHVLDKEVIEIENM